VACQALDLIDEKPSPVHARLLALVREKVPHYDKDREIRLDIEHMNELIRRDDILRIVWEEVPDFD